MSDRKRIHQEISKLSQQIQSLNDDMQRRNDLSVLDIDLLRKHTIDLYEGVNHLRLVMKDKVESVPSTSSGTDSTGSEKDLQPESTVKTPVAPPAPVAPEPVEGVVGVEEVAEIEKTETKEEKKPVIVLDTEALQTVQAEPVTEEPADTGKVVHEHIVEETRVEHDTEETESGETISTTTTETTVVEKTRYVTEEPVDLAGRLGNAPIGDLKRAISIAKKFEYISSLFGGNVEKYAHAVHRLNNMNNGDEAFNLLNELRVEQKWDEEDSNYLELANLVRRRYLG